MLGPSAFVSFRLRLTGALAASAAVAARDVSDDDDDAGESCKLQSVACSDKSNE